MSDYYGLPVRTLNNPSIEVTCLENAGPRIVGLRYKGSANLLCELPENAAETSFGPFRLFGGHRLWHAPEAMPRSYIPDNQGVTVSIIPNGLTLDGTAEPGTGIHKQIQVQLDTELPIVHLTHTLINEGLWEVELAPWAITQFRLGGKCILPIQETDPGAHQLLPNRRIALWNYAHIHDPRLRLEDDFILLEAREQMPPFKIGAYNPRGWIAYWLDGILFRKSFDASPSLVYPDFGCNAETYSNEEFIELESLGPLTRLAPGQSVNHIETWQVYESLDQDFLPGNLRESM
jgi:hypothetical protein